MFCCRLACHDTLEVPQYHRGGGGSVFVVYLEHVLLSTCLPRHSRSTTVPQGGAGVVYLLFIWNMFCCRLACHDTLEVPQYHRGGRGVVTLPPSRGGGVPWTSNSAPYIHFFRLHRSGAPLGAPLDGKKKEKKGRGCGRVRQRKNHCRQQRMQIANQYSLKYDWVPFVLELLFRCRHIVQMRVMLHTKWFSGTSLCTIISNSEHRGLRYSELLFHRWNARCD